MLLEIYISIIYDCNGPQLYYYIKNNVLVIGIFMKYRVYNLFVNIIINNLQYRIFEKPILDI